MFAHKTRTAEAVKSATTVLTGADRLSILVLSISSLLHYDVTLLRCVGERVETHNLGPVVSNLCAQRLDPAQRQLMPNQRYPTLPELARGMGLPWGHFLQERLFTNMVINSTEPFDAAFAKFAAATNHGVLVSQLEHADGVWTTVAAKMSVTADADSSGALRRAVASAFAADTLAVKAIHMRVCGTWERQGDDTPLRCGEYGFVLEDPHACPVA